MEPDLSTLLPLTSLEPEQRPAGFQTEWLHPLGPDGSPADPYSPLLCTDLKVAGQTVGKWLWHGYLAPGEVTLLTSQWKSGKSTLISELLRRMKRGGELAGLPVATGKAIVLSEESPTMWHERDRGIAFDDHLCWFCRPFRGKPRHEDWLALLDQIGRIHARGGVDLLVIDSLANLAPMRSENDAGEMLKTMLSLERLTTLGLSVLVAHHPAKGKSPQPGQLARGSGALSGFVDIIIEMDRLSRRSHKDRRRRLRAFSRHDATPPYRVIEWSAAGTDYLYLGDSADMPFEQGWQFLRQILAKASGPLTRCQILRDWPDGALPPPKHTLWRWLDLAVKERTVEKEGAGSKKEPHRYCLPEMRGKWVADELAALTARIMAG